MTESPHLHRSLGDALAGRANSFNFLRLFFASLVIFHHALPLGALGSDPVWKLTRGQTSMGSIAVLAFFAISGFLIAKSAARLDVVQYMWHRTIRIFPAYWTVLIFTAAIVGPLAWLAEGNAIGTYLNLAPNGPIWYVLGNADLQISSYGIHDIFAATTPYGEEVGAPVFNGSIWTLIYEWWCYLIVAVLALGGVLTRSRPVLLALTSGLGILQLLMVAAPDRMIEYLPYLADPQLLPLVFVFLVGSTMASYRDVIPFNDRLGLFALFIVGATAHYGAFPTFGHVAGVYLVLYLGARLPGWFQRIGAKNDYSYGIYVYGFLVQQVLAYLGVHRWGYVPFSLIALAVSAGFAWLSWHGVEKRALQLKGWGPGKGVRHWWDAARTVWNRTTQRTVQP